MPKSLEERVRELRARREGTIGTSPLGPATETEPSPFETRSEVSRIREELSRTRGQVAQETIPFQAEATQQQLEASGMSPELAQRKVEQTKQTTRPTLTEDVFSKLFKAGEPTTGPDLAIRGVSDFVNSLRRTSKPEEDMNPFFQIMGALPNALEGAAVGGMEVAHQMIHKKANLSFLDGLQTVVGFMVDSVATSKISPFDVFAKGRQLHTAQIEEDLKRNQVELPEGISSHKELADFVWQAKYLGTAPIKFPGLNPGKTTGVSNLFNGFASVDELLDRTVRNPLDPTGFPVTIIGLARLRKNALRSSGVTGPPLEISFERISIA